GYVTSENDSRLLDKNYENAFIFDASISPGNSGGGIFAVRDGKFELVGITSAMYMGANDLYIGVKINGVSEVFKRNSIRCVDGWKCNFSSSEELKL
ncbi:MAG: S1C family serine protease, partial [Nanoarchaeota archaeon]